ncbi:MAG: hypothetical protein LBI62_07825, partial [Candidatus Accumulibacter sp.]|nr:hypothetical protein [Accumulibacter sp.]
AFGIHLAEFVDQGFHSFPAKHGLCRHGYPFLTKTTGLTIPIPSIILFSIPSSVVSLPITVFAPCG